MQRKYCICRANLWVLTLMPVYCHAKGQKGHWQHGHGQYPQARFSVLSCLFMASTETERDGKTQLAGPHAGRRPGERRRPAHRRETGAGHR